MARFFIDRPVFAWVVSLLICLLGVLAITGLPVAQYPNVAPPAISVKAVYSGASSETLTDTVTSVIEQQLNGIDNLLYMSSTADASGVTIITLYFKPGTNADTAQVQVQNKVQLATPSLPQVVQQTGITVAKATRNFMMFFTLSSEDGSLDEIALGNYLAANVLDPIRRVEGVGEVTQFGTQYAMRVWLNPDKLVSYNLTPADISAAIQAQNTQVPIGQIGMLPSVDQQQLNIIMQGRATLRDVQEFNNIALRVNTDGSRVYLRDVARVELAGEDYSSRARVNGRPSSAAAIKLAPSANALNTAEAIRAKLDELSKFFPASVRVDYPLDTSAFVKISVEEVVKTLVEAIVLVFLVMYLFLQNFRATLIPTIVVPVALLGTFGCMAAFGFSINVLTMFGMVLAIGILVDDAIVVVENVERIMSEEGLSPKEATRKAMGQITSALIGITLVLTAVFIPMAFFGGSVGTIYRQFSMSLVASMIFSVFLALSLTPALCATLLKPVEAGHHHEKRGFFGWFNRAFNAFTHSYSGWVRALVKRTVFGMVALIAIIVGVGFLYVKLPSAFLPDEDQGYFLTNVNLPVGAADTRTRDVILQMEDYLGKQEEIESYITVAGFSFNGRGQNSALAFVRLKPWEERKGAQHKVQEVIKRAMMGFGGIKDAIVFPLNPPAIAELGTSTGFDFWLKDEANVGHEKMMAARDQLMAEAVKSHVLAGVRVQGLEDAAVLKVELDQDKAVALGVSLADINTTMQTAFGSFYVNNFVNGPRIQRVIVQLDAKFRMSPEDLKNVHVRNKSGQMVPLGAFLTTNWSFGSPQLQRYNGVPAVNIAGAAAPGRSSGEAMVEMERLAKDLPPGIGYEWSGQSYEERLSGSQAPMLYGLSLLVVFLCLAALYESWSIPFAVIMVVPLGIIGALLAVTMRDFPNDVFFKVGLLTTVGLATKNAILIIEYAVELRAKGMSLVEAIVEAVHLRLRPILMTSMAFILGVMPLAISTGAGSASQNAIGTGVAGGMFAATVLAIFLVPVFYVFVSRLVGGKNADAPREPEGPGEDSSETPEKGETQHA
ncbi:efflux RND transporter permease subunit [Luteolibacter ambystomatis]|uniref:Efflux RND transporter permease subunit n=1 Tax=Luteolibacter ambystomatis TaxID=2824561 RepID=A0A975PGK8_9BACT|nr:efflux RND transporter permease subunit [Luteolibacter ambystomatis]QUE52675.1 efflux RND transporter permease subunit [Luteolibacter ambystomatis]